MVSVPPIKMVMTEGWFIALFYPHYIYISSRLWGYKQQYWVQQYDLDEFYHVPQSSTFFPTCQVKVVRFYHGCSGSSSFSSTSSSSSSFSSTTSASTSTSTSALPTLRSSPTSARSGHCWTSTAGSRSEWARLDLNRKVLSAVGTAGLQPGTFRAFRAQWAPLDLSGQMERQNICQKDCQNICQLDCQNICHIECHIECQNICEKECHIECQNICQIERQNIYQIKCWKICQIEWAG